MNKEDFIKQYQTKKWYEISKRIKARDNNTCQICGCNNKPLSVHHLYYGDNGSIFNVPDSALITLCEDCHNDQKEYRQDSIEILDNFRSIYTDYEIFQLMLSLQNMFGNSGPVYHRTITPIGKHNIHIFDKDSHDKILRLSKWRTKVLEDELKREALIEYHVLDSDKEEIEYWFRKNFNESLYDYQRKLESDSPNMIDAINKEINTRRFRILRHGNS